MAIEPPATTEIMPQRSKFGRLLGRLSGTSMRRDRVPQWLKPTMWPLYPVPFLALLIGPDVPTVLVTIFTLGILYLMGFFIPLKMFFAGTARVMKPFVGMLSVRLAARGVKGLGLQRRPLGWGKVEWVGQQGGVTVCVRADAAGLSVAGHYERPAPEVDDGRHRLTAPTTVVDSFLLEDRVEPISTTWRRSGDLGFDTLVQITDGHRSTSLPAILSDFRRRTAVAEFLVHRARRVPYRCEIEGNIVRARTSIFRGGLSFRAAFDAVVDTASALDLDGTLPDRLAEGADHCDEALGAAWCLGTLLLAYPEDPRAQARAHLARSHPDVIVRLLSAILTETHDEVLNAALVEISEDAVQVPENKAHVSRGLALAVGTEAPPSTAMLAALARSLRGCAIRVELLQLMATTPWGLDTMAEIALDPEEPLKGLVFRMLADRADARFEEAFIGGLNGPNHVQMSCVVALREVGTLKSVAPLIPLRDKVFGDTRVRAIARDAIQLIQGRVPKGARGQLSLISQDDQVGRMSLASSETATADSQPLDGDEM